MNNKPFFNIKRSYRHFYHLVDQSPWPVFVSFSAMIFTLGFVVWAQYGIFSIFGAGMVAVLYSMFVWFKDVVRESTFQGYHTKAVRRGLTLGIILFIVSEVFFFLSFFWAFFHSSFAPNIQIGSIWPPKGLENVVFSATGIPLLNTALLLTSGASITWAHYAIVANFRKSAILGFVFTLLLSVIFTMLQMREYSEASFSFSDGVYGSVFFIATGFHGIHVIIGTIFIIVCFVRFLGYQFTKKHHEGFVFASWYWHFVDVVWLFLYFSIYLWGNWIVTIDDLPIASNNLSDVSDFNDYSKRD